MTWLLADCLSYASFANRCSKVSGLLVALWRILAVRLATPFELNLKPWLLVRDGVMRIDYFFGNPYRLQEVCMCTFSTVIEICQMWRFWSATCILCASWMILARHEYLSWGRIQSWKQSHVSYEVQCMHAGMFAAARRLTNRQATRIICTHLWMGEYKLKSL